MSLPSFPKAIVTGLLVLLSVSPSYALSMLGRDTTATERTEPVRTTIPAASAGTGVTSPAVVEYLDKRTLPALTEAMRINREHRRMFSELTAPGNRSSAYTKFIRALDVRYALLSAVGESLLRATTREEIAEGNAAAEAILAIRTDLDRAVSATQMAIIDNARQANGYLGGCNDRGELVDGTDCTRAQTDIDGEIKTFWVQPWDSERFRSIDTAE
jgi:hypothetical protein